MKKYYALIEIEFEAEDSAIADEIYEMATEELRRLPYLRAVYAENPPETADL